MPTRREKEDARLGRLVRRLEAAQEQVRAAKASESRVRDLVKELRRDLAGERVARKRAEADGERTRAQVQESYRAFQAQYERAEAAEVEVERLRAEVKARTKG